MTTRRRARIHAVECRDTLPATAWARGAAARAPSSTRLRRTAVPAGGEPSLVPGELLRGTPYVVVRLLGEGGMGEVYEVEHRHLGRRFALKVLHARHRARADLGARLREEARALAALSHPSLVEVLDLGTLRDGRPFFTMELLRGRDLRHELEARGAVAGPFALALVAQALDGLAVAHAAGLIHCDVKLENLFLCDAGTLRVLDFGMAGSAAYVAVGGTPRTMAPEQGGAGPIDARADLYACGIVLYELLAGRGPFDDLAGDASALRLAHRTRTPAPASDLAPQPISAAVEAILARALQKNPAERFQTALEMAAALRGLLGSCFTRDERFTRRRRGGEANPGFIEDGLPASLPRRESPLQLGRHPTPLRTALVLADRTLVSRVARAAPTSARTGVGLLPSV